MNGFWEGGQQDRWPAQDLDNVTTNHESRSLSKAEPKFAHLDSLRLHSMWRVQKKDSNDAKDGLCRSDVIQQIGHHRKLRPTT